MVDLQSWFLITTLYFFDAAASVYAATASVAAALKCFCRRGTDAETYAKADAETHLRNSLEMMMKVAPLLNLPLMLRLLLHVLTNYCLVSTVKSHNFTNLEHLQ